MIIQNISHISSAYNRQIRLNSAKAAKQRTPAASRPAVDRYEPQGDAADSKSLSAIRSKIRSGFYRSESVIEDLTESFAKAFSEEA